MGSVTWLDCHPKFRVLLATPKGNWLLTPRHLLIRESESCFQNSAQSGGNGGFPFELEGDGRETETSRTCRQMQETARNTAENEKTPGATLSAFSVNWCVSGSPLFVKSSPEGSLFVTMRAFGSPPERRNLLLINAFKRFESPSVGGDR